MEKYCQCILRNFGVCMTNQIVSPLASSMTSTAGPASSSPDCGWFDPPNPSGLALDTALLSEYIS